MSYENKAHQKSCGLRFIPPESIKAQRETFGAGEPPHCTCLKPLRSLMRLNKLLAEREESK